MTTAMAVKVTAGPSVGSVWQIPPQGGVLGRSHTADFYLDDGALSRRHCRFFTGGDMLFVEDLGSSNGTLVNGVPAAGPTVIRPGDRIELGSVCLDVVLAAAAPAVKTQVIAPETVPSVPKAAAVPNLFPDGAAGTESAPAEPQAVDLGLSPEAASPVPGRHGRRGLLIVLIVVSVAVVAAGVLFQLTGGGAGTAANVPRALSAPRALPFEFRYERLAMDAERLFRYVAVYTNDRVLELTVDDLGAEDRSFAKRVELSEKDHDTLRDLLLDSGYAAIPPIYPEQSADGGQSFRRRALTLVMGCDVWQREAANASDRAFDRLCDRLELFLKNEAGLWAESFSVAELTELARQRLDTARRYWAERDLDDGRLHASVTAYREGLDALTTLNPKPSFAAELQDGLREAEALLSRRYEDLAFAVERAMNTQQYEEAAKLLQQIRRLIPDRDDRRNADAGEQLLMVERQFLNRRR